MQRAIDLSKKSLACGGGPFGAVIVKNDEIVGEGMNCVVSKNDPTAHAEIVAIRMACERLATFNLSGSIIFTSCEPCPMCLSAIWWARIDKIYYGNTRHDAAGIGFDDADIYNEIAVENVKRRLPLLQLMHSESIKVFQEWAEIEKKHMY
ncbi:nucleoside deaminase [Oceanidesulfovibrio marinus]|uniref:Nucleoside deaminase n=2 Tax=Oceanidesulfovibrio marinus TaxID=370038 RepID=A0ABX6NNU7_9BACT|nr:nucleoside deaminase [Oceanidesulfovibrio marinus]